MRRREVDSSSIKSVGYSTSHRLLEVEFHHGAVYQYLDVPHELFDALLAADSKGAFFNEAIKNSFVFNRVE